MKKTISLLILFVSMFFISCSRVPFEVKKPIEEAALVYVYAIPSYDTERTTKYKIAINGKYTKGFVGAFEYITYDLKPMSIVMSGIRNDIEKQELPLNLESGKSYYIRIQSFSDDFAKFTFELVDKSQALEELKSTVLAGAYKKEDNIIQALILPEKDTNKELVQKEGAVAGMTSEQLEALIDKKVAERTAGTSSASSSSPTLTRTGNKLEDIRNAYEMKKQGLLSEEEFLKMKSEILAK